MATSQGQPTGRVARGSTVLNGHFFTITRASMELHVVETGRKVGGGPPTRSLQSAASLQAGLEVQSASSKVIDELGRFFLEWIAHPGSGGFRP